MIGLKLLLPLLFLWSPKEKSGFEEHPFFGYEDFAAGDSILYFEVEHYDLNLDIDIPAESISATATVALKMLASSDSIKLDFVGLEISDVKEGAVSRSYERHDSALVISLGSTVPAGTELALTISYHGKPTIAPGGFGRGMYIDSSSSNSAVTYTCSAPWGAKYWFPCQDCPQDKATMEMFVTVPEGYEVISNGLLAYSSLAGADWSFHWVEAHPIATYLIAFAASRNYALTTDTVQVGSDKVPIHHWVLKADSAEVTPKLAVVSDIMEYFSELFYPYPFKDEKYAHVYAPVSGAMENQTCTHINTSIAWDWDAIVAHEFSHSWWGNSTTCRYLKHMWLNEGFATYCSALWIEHAEGPQAYQDYYEEQIASVYLQASSIHPYSIIDPPWPQIYSALTYEKPAAVLHMLRRIVGDEDFFRVLKTYGERFQDSTAASQDFESVVTEVTGKNYSWFFNEWLRAPGHPRYMTTWSSQPDADSFFVSIHLAQTQNWPADVGIFTMPVEFAVIRGSDTSYLSFVDSLKEQTFVFRTDAQPSSIVFDPHGNILKKTQAGIEDGSEPAEVYFDCSLISQGALTYSTNLREPFDILLYDASGRKLLAKHLNESAGKIDLKDFPNGVYFVRFESESHSENLKTVLLSR